MDFIVCDYHNEVAVVSFNRQEKMNAFNDQMLQELNRCVEAINDNPAIRILLLKARGKHFSAGADIHWMQKMLAFDEAQNHADAMILATLMHNLYNCKKITIAVVQGRAMGGGAGLVAACDIAIATDEAQFCFSEVKLGLIPAVISPYVIKAIGARRAKQLFISAELFDAQQALHYNLIQFSVPTDRIDAFVQNYLRQLQALAPQAMLAAKALVFQVADRSIDTRLVSETAQLIAQKRVSKEGQLGLHAFLKKEKPSWS